MIFRLFKKVYVELDSSFIEQSLNMFDCMVLSPEIKAPSKNLVASYRSYHDALKDFDFNPTALFDSLYRYDGKKSLMLYSTKVGFAQIVTQYWQHIYPNSPKLYEDFYRLTTDRISLIYSNLLAANGDVYLQGLRDCQLTQSEYQAHCSILFEPEHTFSEEIQRNLPFEYLYGDHFHSDRFKDEFKTSLRLMVANDLRYLFLELKDYLIARSSDFDRFFPHIQKTGWSFTDAYHNEPFFKICFDPNVVTFSGGGGGDLSDVRYVLEAYGIDHLREIFRLVNDIDGDIPNGIFTAVLPTAMLNTQHIKQVSSRSEVSDGIFDYIFGRKARAFLSDDYTELLDSNWLDSTASYRLFRRRHNYLLLSDMKKRKGPYIGQVVE